MNAVVDLIMSHRSIRSFRNEPLTEEQIETIVRCAQSASSSNFMQAYSIIGVTDPAKKAKLAEISGGSFVETCGHLFLFCADLHRLKLACQMENADLDDVLESTERFMVAVADCSLAAQNAAIAAESMGLGICYVGGIRNDVRKVCEILNLPDFVFPLYGLAVGYPAEEPELKPRLPLGAVYFENEYLNDEKKFRNMLEQYNQEIRKYYRKRTGGKEEDSWTERMVKTLSRRARMDMKARTREKGFCLDSCD
jgi:Nitroreductase family.